MEDEQDDYSNFKPDLPIPISYVAGRYLIFDVRAVSYIRREHRLCGYNIGTLPQHPSQNVFLGLPTLLMPEEAQLLIDKKVGFLLDDAKAHDRAVYERNKAQKVEFIAKVKRQACEVEKLRAQEHEAATRRALSRRTNARSTVQTKDDPPSRGLLDFDDRENVPPPSSPERSASTQPQDTPIRILSTPASSTIYHITPTTSRLLLLSHDNSHAQSAPAADADAIPTNPIPHLPRSYPLFTHLHSQGYYLTPGLRFGCQYSVYPGDPLRFHSHFLAVGVGWEEEMDLMEIVGGGRLGTGVKKGFLVGGEEPESSERDGQKGKGAGVGEKSDGVGEKKTRTFSIEWAVM